MSSAPAPAPAKTTARFSFGGAPKCKNCQKSVYENEKIVYDQIPYHQECFKCVKCKNRIPLVNVAMISGDLYCKPCFKKIFSEKGRYDSFGDKTVAKWTANDQARKSSSSTPPASGSSGTGTSTAPSVTPIAEEAKVSTPQPSPSPEPEVTPSPSVVEETPAPIVDTPATAATTNEEAAPAATSEPTPVDTPTEQVEQAVATE